MVLESRETNRKSRIDYIDMFRGAGIIFMIMGHIGYGDNFDYFIHAFHMPMFFWISGYLFNHTEKEKISLSTWMVKKAKSLLLPYFVFGVIHYILYVVIGLVTHKTIELTPLFHLLSVNTTGLIICGALWFLTALFFTDIIFFFIDRYISNNIFKAFIIIIIAVFGNIANMILPFTLPFALSASFVGVGLYYVGYLTQKYQKKKYLEFIMNFSWLPNIVLSVITAYLIFINGYVNMRIGAYANIPLFWVNAIFSIIVGINFARLICQNSGSIFLVRWINSIGKDSIIYVCLNQLMIIVVKKGVSMFSLPTTISKLAVLIITLLFLFIVSKIIVNTKLKILIGKG